MMLDFSAACSGLKFYLHEAVKIFAFLELEKTISFPDGHELVKRQNGDGDGNGQNSRRSEFPEMYELMYAAENTK